VSGMSPRPRSTGRSSAPPVRLLPRGAGGPRAYPHSLAEVCSVLGLGMDRLPRRPPATRHQIVARAFGTSTAPSHASSRDVSNGGSRSSSATPGREYTEYVCWQRG
jgi:hypothetical protein